MSNCPNCDRLNNELKRIANANMVTPLALYHQRTAESINNGWVKVQAQNAELKRLLREVYKDLDEAQEKLGWDCDSMAEVRRYLPEINY